jgi:site-specific recombinase XerC
MMAETKQTRIVYGNNRSKDMIENQTCFLKYLQELNISSAKRYITFLRQVSDKTGENISSKTLCTEAHIENLARRIAATGMAPKSVLNYKSVMRHYVTFVGKCENK